jgi:hypothetical protein
MFNYIQFIVENESTVSNYDPLSISFHNSIQSLRKWLNYVEKEPFFNKITHISQNAELNPHSWTQIFHPHAVSLISHTTP